MNEQEKLIEVDKLMTLIKQGLYGGTLNIDRALLDLKDISVGNFRARVVEKVVEISEEETVYLHQLKTIDNFVLYEQKARGSAKDIFLSLGHNKEISVMTEEQLITVANKMEEDFSSKEKLALYALSTKDKDFVFLELRKQAGAYKIVDYSYENRMLLYHEDNHIFVLPKIKK